MNITEFIARLKAYVESHTPNYQDSDAETLLEMLFKVYTEFNGFDNQIIREDFNNLYAAMNGKTLREMDQIIYPVCALCRDHEKTGFQEGVKVGIRLAQEANMAYTYTSIDQLPITLCAEQVAQVLGISRAGAYTLMHSKGFPTIQIGKRMVVPKDKLLAWMEAQSAA